jgi:spore coat protein CotH
MRSFYQCTASKYSFLAIISAFIGTVANNCTLNCDASYDSGISVSMCGTDFETHSTKADVFFDNDCYDVCGVMTYYAGSCGCPNDCHASFQQGKCGIDNICVCIEGWGGKDCSLPVWGNTCSFHGKFMVPGNGDSVFPFEYCLCDAGWTGPDCSTQLFRLGTLPWGVIFDDANPYDDDEYKENHPLWNISVLATVRLEISDDALTWLLLPSNLFSDTYQSADVHFDNGNLQQSFSNVGLRIKGQGSRMDQKKGWYLKLNEFVAGQSLKGVKKIGFKGGAVNDDTLLKSQLTSDFYHAMGLPTQRSSYALLYINNVYMGLYVMIESVDSDFLDSRFDGDGSGDMMKLYWNVHLGFYGFDQNYYKDANVTNSLGFANGKSFSFLFLFENNYICYVCVCLIYTSGVAMNFYQRAQGGDDWTDFVNWLYFFNSSTPAEFASQLSDNIDVKTLLRSMVVESFMISDDNIASGNNMYIYHETKSAPKDRMCLFSFDFDDVFKIDKEKMVFDGDTDIFSFFLDEPAEVDYEEYNPLINRMLAEDSFRSSYLSYYQTFLDTIFGSGSVQQPSERYAALMQFVLPWVARDAMWRVSYGVILEEFIIDAELTVALLNQRYQNVTLQVKSYSS